MLSLRIQLTTVVVLAFHPLEALVLGNSRNLNWATNNLRARDEPSELDRKFNKKLSEVDGVLMGMGGTTIGAVSACLSTSVAGPICCCGTPRFCCRTMGKRELNPKTRREIASNWPFQVKPDPSFGRRSVGPSHPPVGVIAI